MNFIPFRKSVAKGSDAAKMEDITSIINRLQDSTEQSITSIQQNTRLDSQTIPNQTLYPYGINIINHGLGKKLTGWAIVRKNAAAEIWDMQDTNTRPSRTLYLVASDTATVSIEVW